MKKLPKIYQNDFNKKINNNKEICYLKNEEEKKMKEQSVEQSLEGIFNGMGYAFNIPVIIETNDKVYKTSLIAKTKHNVITLDNDIILIENIKNIQIVK